MFDLEPLSHPQEILSYHQRKQVERDVKSIPPVSFGGPKPLHITGFLWTTRGRYVGRVILDYTSIRKEHAAAAAARHAFNRSMYAGKLGADVHDLAGHILFVPEPPFGDPVMVK